MDDSEFVESLEKIRRHLYEIILLYKSFTRNQSPYRLIEDLPILDKVSELIQSSEEIVDHIRSERLSDVSEDTYRKLQVL